jgi:hypothetical protein
MTNEEILKKAIDKAIKNGWMEDMVDDFNVVPYGNATLVVKIVYTEDDDTDTLSLDAFTIIFSHDFAKAFWPEEKERCFVCPKCKYTKSYSKNDDWLFCPNDGRKLKTEWVASEYGQAWQYHLQQMVLEEDPVKYLEKFI